MKKVTLKTMTLVNFKGHKDLTVQFNDHSNISGYNGTGKSTVFDSFIWLLFGKDQFDRKDFEIIPTVNGIRKERIDSEVSAAIDFDGREMNLKRVLHQKWVRRRGSSVEEFDGCETLYYINDVPLKAGEYKARIDLIIEETIFKLITNPTTFLNLHWTKQREFLFQIAGTISDHQIAELNPNFALLLDAINGKSLADYKKELSARKKKLNDDLANIQPRIDQTARLMPGKKDFTAIQAEIKLVDAEIAKIDEQISDLSKAIRGQYDSIQATQKQINELQMKQVGIINNERTKAQNEAFEENQKILNQKNSIASLEANAKRAKDNLETTSKQLLFEQSNLTKKKAEIDALRNSWIAENEKEYHAKAGCLVCPVFGSECGDSSALGKHEQAQELAKKAFFDAKEKALADIHSKGISLTADVKKIEEQISDLEIAQEGYTNHFKECESNLSDAKANVSIQAEVYPRAVIANEIPEWLEISQEIHKLEATIQEVKPVDNSEVNAQKDQLIIKRDGLLKELSEKDLITKYEAEIKKLETEASDIAQQIADVEKTEFTIADFTKAKIDECERRINGLFEIVRFKLFDKTIDGNEFEACIPLNLNGVPIAATNTAERINAGLDIIRTLSDFYNVSAPIFCDGAESVNKYLNTGSQMVFLRVTEERVLTIN